jgi:RNA polymerase sigma-70 factor (ECF subfamily)
MDHELLIIRRAIDGDEGALRALWTRHAPHIDIVVRRLVGGDLDLAADIAQEVWIQIFGLCRATAETPSSAPGRIASR